MNYIRGMNKTAEDISKLIKTLKIIAAIVIACVGWLCISYGMVSAGIEGSSYGALAVILIELGAAYLVLATILAIDLYGSRKDNPILSDQKLIVSLSIAGFLSSIPAAIMVFSANSPLVFVYALLASSLPFVAEQLLKKTTAKEIQGLE